jgi:ABC-type amino acid transport substrate-binding protein
LAFKRSARRSRAAERADLSDAVDATIETLRESGEFASLQAAWPGISAAEEA